MYKVKCLECGNIISYEKTEIIFRPVRITMYAFQWLRARKKAQKSIRGITVCKKCHKTITFWV